MQSTSSGDGSTFDDYDEADFLDEVPDDYWAPVTGAASPPGSNPQPQNSDTPARLGRDTPGALGGEFGDLADAFDEDLFGDEDYDEF